MKSGASSAELDVVSLCQLLHMGIDFDGLLPVYFMSPEWLEHIDLDKNAVMLDVETSLFRFVARMFHGENYKKQNLSRL